MKKNNNMINFSIKITNKKILVYLGGKLFLCQHFLSPTLNCSRQLYTFLYISKILTTFGLIAPINKKSV